MKGNQGVNAFGAVVSGATETRNQPVRALMGPPKLMMAQKIQQLEGLFLLETARPYADMWKELKANIIELTRTWRIMVNNEHILKLMNKVKELITVNKKQGSLTAVFYAEILRKGLTKW